MGLVESVGAEIEGLVMPRWKRDLIVTLAEAQEKSPNASTSKELRAVMDEVGAVETKKSGDVADDLASKRAARREAAG